MSTTGPEDKGAIRRRVVASRAALDIDRLAVTAGAFADRAVRIGELGPGATATAYVAADGEPGTMALVDRLSTAGVRVLLPVLCPDFDLEWAAYEPGRLVEARFGLMEPTGPRLGKDAIADAQVVFCPGVAGTTRGERLGRGGGSYDRALTRSDPAATRCLLLYDDEVLDALPVEPHDALVDYLCTPTRIIEASPGRPEHQGRVGR